MHNSKGRYKAEPLEQRLLLSAISFQPSVNYPLPITPAAVAVADLGTGHPDIVVAGTNNGTELPGSGYVSILLGNGQGEFSTGANYAIDNYPNSLAVADLGNGHQDIVVADQYTSSITVLFGTGNGNFLPPKTLAISDDLQSISIAIADLGNGHPDIVVAGTNSYKGSNSGEVNVLLGDGKGSFAAQPAYALYGVSSGVAVADVGNGHPDIVVSGGVLLGNGDGTLQPELPFPTQSDSRAMAVADLGNGQPDLVLADQFTNALDVVTALGDGMFQALPSVATGNDPDAVAIADLDNGHPDLIDANEGDGTISLFPGNGDGTFSPPRAFGVGIDPNALAVSDLGNGRPDIVVTNFNDNDVSVLLADAAPAPTTTSLTSSAGLSVAGSTVTFTATVNAFGADPTGTVTFFNGTAPLGSPVSLASGTATLTTASLPPGNNIVTAQYSGDANYAANGSFSLTQSVITVSPTLKGSTTSVVAGSPLNLKEKLVLTTGNIPVDGNSSDQILLSTDSTSQNSVFTLASTDGKLRLKAGGSKSIKLPPSPPVPASLENQTYHMLIQSVDTGGIVSTIDTGQTLQVLTPTVDLAVSFVKVPASAKVGQKISATLAVTNATDANVAAKGDLALSIDGTPSGQTFDAVVLTSATRAVNIKPGKSIRLTVNLSIAETSYLAVNLQRYNVPANDGFIGLSSNFQSAQPIWAVKHYPAKAAYQIQTSLPAGGFPVAMTVADLGNGQPDIVVVNQYDQAVGILVGNGDGTFQPPVIYPPANYPSAVAVADLGGGHRDIVVTNQFTDSVSVLIGNGDGTFNAPVTYATGNQPVAVAIADLGNGHPDIVVANQNDNSVGILYGNGDGTFQPQQALAVGAHPDAIAIADLGNGHPDLIVGNRDDGTVGVLMGNGDGTFLPQKTFQAGSQSQGPTSITIADLGNGHPDIVAATFVSINVLLGDGTGSFQPQQTYTSSGNQSVSAAALGNGHVDLVTIDNNLDGVSVLLGNGDGTFQNPVEIAGYILGPIAAVVADLGNGQPDILVAGSGTVSILAPAPQNVSATLVSKGTPDAVAGRPLPFKEYLTLTANPGVEPGYVSAKILLSPDQTAVDSVMTLASTVKELNLKPGRHATVALHLPRSIPATVPAGTYHVLIQLTDTTGVIETFDSGQSLKVK